MMKALSEPGRSLWMRCRIDSRMHSSSSSITFALRRKEVVEGEPAISQMLECWPALFTEDQIYLEFNRIVGRNLKQEFLEAIDRHSSCLMEIFLSSKRENGKSIDTAELIIHTHGPTDVRTTMLQGLPIILADDPMNFFKIGHANSFCHVDIGILLDGEVGSELSFPQVRHFPLKIIIEGQVVMQDTEDLPKAMCVLFGMTYALHLNYPKSIKNTFQFIKQGLLSLGNLKLKPRLQSLRNLLAM